MKGYTAVSAISKAFKILQTGVVDQQQREALELQSQQQSGLVSVAGASAVSSLKIDKRYGVITRSVRT